MGHLGQRALFLNSGQRVVHRVANDVRLAQDSDNRAVVHDGHLPLGALRLEECSRRVPLQYAKRGAQQAL